MSTHLGAGAGQAIEDAFVLGHILSDTRVSFNSQNVRTKMAAKFKTVSVEDALRAYDTARRPFATEVVERSRTVGFLYEFDGLEVVGADNRRSGASESEAVVASTSESAVIPKATPPDFAERVASGDRAALDRLGSAIYARWAVQWAALPDVELGIAKRALDEAESRGRYRLVRGMESLVTFMGWMLDSAWKGMGLLGDR